MAQARPTTEVGAANLALSHCKQPQIAAFPPTENNTRSRQAALHFGAVRDAVFAEHHWNFARGWESPAASATASSHPTLTIRYPLPPEVIEVRTVRDSNSNKLLDDEWEMEAAEAGEAKVLITDATAPINVEFTKRIENIALWEPLFLDVFALRLGARMAPKLTKNDNDVIRLNADADNMLRPAKSANRRERANSQVSKKTSWVTARQ